MSADLAHVDTWLFDLDNTLYPPSCEVMALIQERMTRFVVRETGMEWDQARALQKRYLHEHGTTLAGLMAHHGVAPEAFIAEVHEVAMDSLRPDLELAQALARLPGRRLVFTNAGGDYAGKVVERLGLGGLFEDIFHIEAMSYIPKPQPAAFERMIARHGVSPKSAAFFEDTEQNLAPAAKLGMTTVLVGPHAPLSTATFVDHKTAELTPFLASAHVRPN